ncbi:hypothetical protein C8J56DRAFT_1043377 [Mycena floridula]|nr:hypothetical protein C8J56DRAFT_1043377 [Mycena floridula]
MTHYYGQTDFTADSDLHLGIVTDTLTYGFNVDVSLVVITDVDTTSAGPDILKQRIGRVGRRGGLADAITFAPTGLHVIPPEAQTTVQAKDDARHRSELPAATLGWYDHNFKECCHECDMKHYSDKGFDIIRCHCSIHETETQNHLLLVQKWVDDSESRKIASGSVLQSDKTYNPLMHHSKSH